MLRRHSPPEYRLGIPCSNERYLIGIDGVVTDDKGNAHKAYLSAGRYKILLNLWEGYKEYDFALLIAICYKSIRIPQERYKDLDVLFADNDETNFHPENLIWKFPDGGIESETFAGFYYIPHFSKYVISKEGIIRNARTGNEVKSFQEERYTIFRIYPDTGMFTSIGRHRLMALTFLPYPNNVSALVVNHKNGKPSEDWIDNLEWVTRARNNQHAYETGLMCLGKEILVKFCETGEVKEFKGRSECARFFNLNRSTVSYRLHAKDQPLYPGNLLFKYKSDKTPWREVTEFTTKGLNSGTPVAVKARDIFTGEIKAYSSQKEASFETAVPHMTINSAVSNSNLGPNSGYDFKKADDNSDWRQYDSDQLEFFRTHSFIKPTLRDGFYVEDTVTGQRKRFFLPEEAGVFVGVGSSMISHALRNKSLMQKRYRVYKKGL